MKKISIVLTLIAAFMVPLFNSGTLAAASEDYIYINNVDNPKTVEQIKYLIPAIDPEDGDITNSVYIIVDNYTANIDKLGEFVVVYGVDDSLGATASVAITVKNVDVTSPSITLDDPTSLRIDQYSNLASNLPQISAIDSFEGDLTSELSITGLQSINTDVLGTHILTYSVKDSTGNRSTVQFTVEVVDSGNPELDGPTRIIKKASTILDRDFYIGYFTAEDDHDGIITQRIRVISDDYVGNANNSGSYQVVLSVSDTEGNQTTKNLTIEVIDSMIPDLIIDDYYWVVPNDHEITDTEFISILKSIQDLPNYTFVYTSITDNYTASDNVIGKYFKSFNLLSETGEEFDRSITLEVVSSDEQVIISTPESSLPSFESIMSIIPWVIGGILVFLFIKSRKKKWRF